MDVSDERDRRVKRLDEAVLHPGDIVLTTTSEAISKAIRMATRSDVSHAMVYVQHCSVIDATGEGVHARNTQRTHFEEECAIHVLRLRSGISAEELSAVTTYMRGHIGTEYSVREALLAGFGGARQWSTKQFCSRLVAQAFASAGIHLVEDPNFCSPADIKASALLVVVPDATKPISVEDASAWREADDIPQRMRSAINAVLGGAREKDPRIQTFDDLHRHLVEHPEQDDHFCGLLESSGYLSLWKVERRKNPWQYDLALMNVVPDSEVEGYCWKTLDDESAGPNRFIVNRGGYTLLSREYGLKFFRVMADLYETLAVLHSQRVEVAAKWLEAHGHIELVPSPALVPHTDEWFAALSRWNPAQAKMTRFVLEDAGRKDVCSVCGDNPAEDYRLDEGHRPAGGVDTLRLCDDCLQIRRASGEPFMPL
ncbi:YiiX/YebB-like N1pC/P60 family cysteine hydrolase [Dyella sp.]|uniref:YiiX/YebB-like N1pC/P60 family cysteine hydrolase n=1 Tax=Dyella sp. TaxID=1869338 RepID=UPI003F7DA7D1